MEFMQQYYPDITAEKFDVVNGDHRFVVINRRENSNENDPATWGDDCWFIDPWGQKVGKASELIPFLKTLPIAARNSVWDYFRWLAFRYFSVNFVGKTLTEEPILKSFISGKQELINMQHMLDTDSATFVDIFNKMATAIEAYKCTLTNSEITKFLEEQQKVIDVIRQEVQKQQEYLPKDQTKYNFKMLVKKFDFLKDEIRKVKKITYNIRKILEIYSNNTPAELKLRDIISIFVDLATIYDFPKDIKTQRYCFSQVVLTHDDGTKEKKQMPITDKTFSPTELVKMTEQETDWTTTRKIKITDNKGLTLFVKKEQSAPTPNDTAKLTYKFWVENEARQKLETESAMQNVVLSF
jgi:hypothetical protein